MTDDELLADLGVVEGEPVHRLLRSVRTAYARDALPQVGRELAAAFSGGLARDVTRGVRVGHAQDGGGNLRRRFRTRLATAGVGAAAVLVNLAGVGSAGWLPGPVQTVFDRATSSVGIDVPRSSTSRDAGWRPERDPEPRSPGLPSGDREEGGTPGVRTVPPGQEGGERETRPAPDRPVDTSRTTSPDQRSTRGAMPGGSPAPDPRPGSGSAPASRGGGATPCPTVPTTVAPPQLPPRSLPSVPGVPVPGGAGGLADVPDPIDPGPVPCPPTTTTSTTRAS